MTAFLSISLICIPSTYLCCCPFVSGTWTPSEDACDKGVNFAFDGVPCAISGDPHCMCEHSNVDAFPASCVSNLTDTTWAGARHDFQGSANGQYYYLSQCAGSSTDDMPFSILGKHTPWHGTVQGLDYLTFELFDDLGAKYYLFLSASLQYYINAEDAVDTLYDNNANNAALRPLTSGQETPIGSKFTFEFTQIWSSRIEARLSIASSFGPECSVSLHMQGQVFGSQQRFMMHGLLFILPLLRFLTSIDQYAKPVFVFCSGRDQPAIVLPLPLVRNLWRFQTLRQRAGDVLWLYDPVQRWLGRR